MMTVHSGLWQNNKTGTSYWVTGTRINATNSNNGQQMVDYENEDGDKYCREIKEFLEKFTKVKLINEHT